MVAILPSDTKNKSWIQDVTSQDIFTISATIMSSMGRISISPSP